MEWTTQKGAGLVQPTSGAIAAAIPLPIRAAHIDRGFWAEWQRVNREVTIPLGATRLEKAGNLHDLRLAAGQEQGSYQGPVYQDSDVYKWLEAVAWERGRQPGDELSEMAEAVIEVVAAAQADDGYLNSYVQTVPGAERFADLADGHELYCAGHLIQAAVAQYRATGDDRLLGVATRFADYLSGVFGEAKRHGVPGHPEIEMALAELYRLTGESRYRDLAAYFVGARGHGLTGASRAPLGYYQDRVPVREATTVEGHAVRALYLAAGSTDVAVETGDAGLLAALEAQWTSMVASKMYLTGGVGSRWEGEAFGEPYELPPDRAYCETSAAIASVLWSWRLYLATGRARYTDLIERTLFNTVIPGLSSHGDRFFYVNTLQLRHGEDGSDSRGPAHGRQEWFTTACCPPNIMRLLASLGAYGWSRSAAGGLALHQFASGTVSVPGPAGPVELRTETDYPWDGRLDIEVLASPSSSWELSIRIPGWCRGAALSVNGEPASLEAAAGSYARVRRSWRVGDRVGVDLPMPVRRTRSPRAVDATFGCTAIERGPLVYCIETADLPPDVVLERVRLLDGEDRITRRDDLLGGIVTVDVPVAEAVADPGVEGCSGLPTVGSSGSPYGPAAGAETYGPAMSVPAIPYFAWANRVVGPMRVWIPRAEAS